jgi:hypothetical protein
MLLRAQPARMFVQKRKVYTVVTKRCDASCLTYSVQCAGRVKWRMSHLACAALRRGLWPMVGKKDLLVGLTCNGRLLRPGRPTDR